LRNPPARETLMQKMIVGTDIETITTLIKEYRIGPKRARKMIDQARGVGPSPTSIPDGTIVIRYIRIPRTNKALYEIIESEPWLDGDIALKQLMDEYGLSEQRAKTILNSAWKQGKSKIKIKGVITRINYHGRGANETYMFSIEEMQ
jgi:hypothetical protein